MENLVEDLKLEKVNLKSKLFYIYIFLDPRKCGTFKYGDVSFNHEPFYVGKGKERRVVHHFEDSVMKDSSNRLKNNVLRKIFKTVSKKEFKQKYVLMLHQGLVEEDAFEKERFLIKTIGKRINKKGPLTNLTDGGEGNRITGINE